ncbi:MAG: hypothetical protein AB4426_18750 [Xenococcaceae cyanobacterium]
MWTINSRDIFPLRSPGGDRFTEFVDALIKAEASIEGVPLSAISTNLRTNLADAGVDTEVRQAMPASKTGWMRVPSCWQYKATEFKNIAPSDLQEEINKSYSKNLIQQGYGYRFCICDDLTPAKKSDWKQILDNEIKKLNPSAPTSQVVTADDLAAWSSQFPAIVVRFFKPKLVSSLDLENWGERIIELTSKFVEVEAWADVKQKIIEHVNLNSSCNSVILSLQGQAGVGKTRLVYESLSGIEVSKSFVLYAIDEKATPEIIAQVSFEGAWKRWVEYDPPAFLDKIPKSLLDAFLRGIL